MRVAACTIFITTLSFCSIPLVKICKPGARKILVISFGKIGGHASLTHALISFLKNTHEVHVIKAEDFHRYANADYYNNMKISIVLTFLQQNLHHLIHNIAHRMPARLVNIFFKIREFCDLLDENNYSMVIFTSPCHVNEVNRTCARRNIPSITIAADYGEPEYPEEFWVRSESTATIVPINSYFNGKSESTIFTLSGMPARPEFSYTRRISKQEAKRRIGVDTKTPCVLVMMGAAGADDIYEIADFVKSDPTKTYILICGNNKEMYKRLVKISPSNFVVLQYVQNPMIYMRAADVFISKPGATSITEAIQCETPCLFRFMNAFSILPSEVPTARYIVENSLGCVIENYSQLIPAIDRMLKTKYTFPHNNALEQCVYMIRQYIRANQQSRKVD